MGGRRQQKQQQQQQQHQYQEPPQLSQKKFPSYLRLPLSGNADANAARYDDVLQGKIKSAASVDGGVSVTTHPQRNEGNVTDVTCGMRRSSPLRFIQRPSPSNTEAAKEAGVHPLLASAQSKQAAQPSQADVNQDEPAQAEEDDPA